MHRKFFLCRLVKCFEFFKLDELVTVHGHQPLKDKADIVEAILGELYVHQKQLKMLERAAADDVRVRCRELLSHEWLTGYVATDERDEDAGMHRFVQARSQAPRLGTQATFANGMYTSTQVSQNMIPVTEEEARIMRGLQRIRSNRILCKQTIRVMCDFIFMECENLYDEASRSFTREQRDELAVARNEKERVNYIGVERVQPHHSHREWRTD